MASADVKLTIDKTSLAEFRELVERFERATLLADDASGAADERAAIAAYVRTIGATSSIPDAWEFVAERIESGRYRKLLSAAAALSGASHNPNVPDNLAVVAPATVTPPRPAPVRTPWDPYGDD